MQTPSYLIEDHEKLNDKINYFLTTLSESEKDIKIKIDQILDEEFGDIKIFENFSRIIFTDIILRDKPAEELLGKIITPSNTSIISYEDKLEVTDKIYSECNNLKSVKKTIVANDDWLNTQDDLIESLSILIKLIGAEYEKLNDKY